MNNMINLKQKLSVQAQIQHMKDSGITFKDVSESEVEDYLSTHTYYFKLKAYAKNFEKYQKYINLDFSYLQDLARLDMHFRELVFKLTVDIEHFLKVKVLFESQKNQKDDGYSVVETFLLQNDKIANAIQEHSKNGYNSDLIQKYNNTFPIWVFLEIISFGDLTLFYNYYCKQFPINNNISAYLWSARILRNAAAHNSCILNRLKESFDDSKINNTLFNVLKLNYQTINVKRIKTYLKNPIIQDFIDVLILYKKLDKSRTMLKKRISEVENFLIRCKKNSIFYHQNNQIIGSYKFISDFFSEYKNSF